MAYVMSRFPKLTETFILYEILAQESAGVQIHVFPLLREHEEILHPEAQRLVDAAHYQPFMSLRILGSQLRMLARQPGAYLGTLGSLLWANRKSRNHFVGALGIFPKTVHNAREMERLGIEHVHAHFATHPAAAGWIIHRLTGISYSFTAHGSDIHVDRTGLAPKVADAAFVAAISEFNRQVIVDECGPWAAKIVEVLHSGVDTDHFRPQERPRHADGRLRIICIGTMHEVKGQAYLLEACASLARDGVDFTCRLVGDGPDEPMLRATAVRLGITEQVVFEGRRTRDEIAALLAETDVLVTPSVPASDGKREGIPVVLMEAMASGVAVVASRLTGIPELVRDGETGLLAEPRDVVGLAGALRRLHDDPALRSRLAAAGRSLVQRDFDIRRNAAALVERVERAVAR
ncbi:MAG TPA: glycosyltransferase [Candidatus Limnocylindria bacterium]|nr:glycosyltransferase [Candidatus Limnocylindria bacterium]